MVLAASSDAQIFMVFFCLFLFPFSLTTEQHFLVQLHDLSILALTPSRKIDGKGIVPYDDR